jgi:uncharacterized protein YfaP (DUF2135 family)
VIRIGPDDDADRPDVDPGSECVQDPDCAADQVCFDGTCVGSGQLRVSLSWDTRTDLDLHVQTPSGAEVDYETPEAGGGELDVDDCVGGVCATLGGPHVENVVFQSAASGRYLVWVENFDGNRDADFDIEVAGAHNETFSGSVGPPPYDHSETFDFTLP